MPTWAKSIIIKPGDGLTFLQRMIPSLGDEKYSDGDGGILFACPNMERNNMAPTARREWPAVFRKRQHWWLNAGLVASGAKFQVSIEP